MVSNVYSTLRDQLGDDCYAGQQKHVKNLIIEMFHQSTHDDSKERILTDFCKEESTLRCLVATVALGMGVQIPDVNLVIQYGCPTSVINYWQEVGRCARDGSRGYAVMLYTKRTLSLKNTSGEMKSVVRSDTCLRKGILNNFAHDTDVASTLGTAQICPECDESRCTCPCCLCCSICRERCPCLHRKETNSIAGFYFVQLVAFNFNSIQEEKPTSNYNASII